MVLRLRSEWQGAVVILDPVAALGTCASFQFTIVRLREKEKNFVGVFVGWQVKCVYNHAGLNSSADEMQGCLENS